jgi:UDP-N-acetylglucosamine 2-epimerase (non-hydrolysing)
MAPVILEMKRRSLPFKVCVTAQHREMLDQVLEFFEIQPDYDLNLMKSGQSLNALSANIFSAIDMVFDDWLGLRQAQPDMGGLRQASLRQAQADVVLVQGDTTTATIIAQAAFHRKIKVGHIEAGLRTYQKYSPFPEEINRQLISRISTWHFTPTQKATENLLNEGIVKSDILQTGNTVIDSLKLVSEKIDDQSKKEKPEIELSGFEKMILVTGHRRENFGKGIEELCKALLELAKNKTYLIIFPVHLNPRTKLMVEEKLQGVTNIKLLPPVNYPQMVWLMQHCNLIISDSGGIQEEAPAFKKPVIVTRSHTEREEAVQAGFSVLTGADSKRILQEAFRILKSPPDFQDIANPFGDGNAARRIVDFLEKQG